MTADTTGVTTDRTADDASDAVVVLDAVRKEFGSFVAVERADFSIGRGEFFSLLGPSGCGKTTLLKMIAGFEQPTSGRILLEGTETGGTPPHKRNVNTVFQQYALFPHMSVLENVAFGLRSKKVAASDARRRAREMLDVVRLGEFATRRPVQLSGGQQQRVALARALVNLPSALLLDEPLAALDLKLREAMQLELKRIQREVDITFIFVTHDQGEALTMSDRIAVMSRGRVEQIGTPTEIYERPSSIFVAGFIGSANLLPGTLHLTNGAAATVLDSGERITVGDVGEARNGDPVTVMLRPERLAPTTDGSADGNSMRLTVRDVIYQGSSVRMIADGEGELELLATMENSADTPALRRGDDITLGWAPEAAYLLRGRSEIIGSTTTDIDEVQATMDGKDLSEHDDAETASGESRVNRRALLIGGGVVAAGAIGALVFSAAGDSSGGGDETAAGAAGGGVGQGAEQVRILNWTEYIDPDEGDSAGTLSRFEAETGIATEYSEGFNDNNQIYGTEFEPYLGNGRPASYDIFCPTYWMAARLKSRDWLAPLPFNLIPNYANLEPTYLDLQWDRGAKYHLPWQAGITGIAYNQSVTGRELKSFADLLDPEWEGQIAFFTEMRDTLGLMMLSQGNDPSAANEDTINEALDAIEEATRSGQVRQFTGNDYLQPLDNGNFAACIAWSGDIAQSTNPDVHFVVPEEGGMSWFDTMVIPTGSPNGVAAAQFMNFVYDPANAARITAWVQYVSPVVGVRDELVKMGGDAAALADSSLLFPDDEDRRRLFVFSEMDAELDRATTERFAGISGA